MNTQKSLHAQCLKGAEYLLAHDYQKAANAFDAVLKADPDNMGANAGVAALLYETGNERPAYKYAQKALKKGFTNAPLLSLVVQIALKLGKFDDAKRYATKAYKLAPKSVEGMQAYLHYLQHTDKWREVEQVALRLLAQSKDANARLTAGTALESVGKTIEAIRIYRNAIADILAAKSPPPPAPYQREPRSLKMHKMRCLILKNISMHSECRFV